MCSLALPVTLVAAEEPSPSAAPTAVQASSQQTSAASTATPASTTAARKSAKAGSASVSILDGDSTSQYVFSPASVTIGAGSTVTWTNKGKAPEGHDVKGDGFESGKLDQGQAYSHTFSAPGSYPYICSIHPFMKGTVVVQDKSGSGGGGGDSGGGGTGGGGKDTPGATSDPSSSGTTPTTGAGSESAAGSSPDAAGTSTQLPSTRLPTLPLLGIGLGLGGLGLLLRRRTRLG